MMLQDSRELIEGCTRKLDVGLAMNLALSVQTYLERSGTERNKYRRGMGKYRRDAIYERHYNVQK
jgi:hypothetical protein